MSVTCHVTQVWCVCSHVRRRAPSAMFLVDFLWRSEHLFQRYVSIHRSPFPLGYVHVRACLISAHHRSDPRSQPRSPDTISCNLNKYCLRAPLYLLCSSSTFLPHISAHPLRCCTSALPSLPHPSRASFSPRSPRPIRLHTGVPPLAATAAPCASLFPLPTTFWFPRTDPLSGLPRVHRS